MATSSDELVGRTLGPYRIVEEIGQGGMAVVFRAVDDELDREVALKVLSTDFTSDLRALERFKREAQTTASLEHPNIIKIFGIGEQDGLHFFAMEYLPHRSLHDLVKDEGKLEIEDAVRVVSKTLAGLSAAHKAGVIHRDLKPENIMMNGDGDPILVDFGIAKTGKGNRLTQTGVLLGTPYYMSPEQITGKEVGVQSDLYSMGVVLYELLTAEVPFQADSTFMITYKHCTEAPPPPRKLNEEIPEALELVVLKSLEKDLAKRYQDADDFIAHLAQVQEGKSVDIEVTRRRDIFEIPDFKVGMAHYREKEFDEARERFQVVVDEVPDPEFAAEANRWLATTFFDEGEYLEAARLYKRTADRWPDSEEAKRVPVYLDGCWFQQLQEGEDLLRNEGRAPALACFDALTAFLDDEGISEDERLENHWIQLMERRAEDLRRQLKRLQVLKWSVIAACLGLVVGSVCLFYYFRFVDPFAGLLLSARYEALRGRVDGVVEKYQQALELKPGNVPTLVRLAEAQLVLGQGEAAQAAVDQALAKDPGNVRGLELAGDLALARRDHEAAFGFLRRAVEASGREARLWAKLGRALEGRGALGDAISAYKSAIRFDRKYAPAYNYLALALWRGQGDAAAARKVLAGAAEVAPRHAPTFHNQGKLLLATARDEAQLAQAEEALLTAVRLDSSEPDTHYHLAVIYSKQGFREKATKELIDAIANSDPDLPPTDRYHYLLGQLREGVAAKSSGAEAAQLREDAEHSYKEAVRIRPEQPTYQARLGRFYWSQGAWEHAEEAFSRWSSLVPSDPEPAFMQGKALLKADRQQEAIEALQRARRLAPEDADIGTSLARALKAAGDQEGSVAVLRQVLASHPAHVPSLVDLARHAIQAGRVDEAQDLTTRLVQAAPLDPNAQTLAGLARLASRDLPGAEASLRQALNQDARHVAALNALGRLLIQQGKHPEGLRHLEASLAAAPFQDEAQRLRAEIDRIRRGGGG